MLFFRGSKSTDNMAPQSIYFVFVFPDIALAWEFSDQISWSCLAGRTDLHIVLDFALRSPYLRPQFLVPSWALGIKVDILGLAKLSSIC